MADYTKSVNFTAKDTLPTGDPGKIVKGAEIDAEFDNIQNSSATKADKASPTFTGTASFDILDTSTLRINGTGVTATASELNKLDGVTATTAELNILDGVTATTAELNTLDGITATVTELNYTDGVTSNIQTQIDAKAPTADPDFTGTVEIGDWSFEDTANWMRVLSPTFKGFYFTDTGNFSLNTGSFADVTTNVNTVYLSPGGSSYFMKQDNDTVHLVLNTWGSLGSSNTEIGFYVDGVSVGSISTTSAGTNYNTSSDGRLKERIKDSPKATPKVKALKIREFDWKEDKTHQEFGLIAQEAREVFPEAVSEDPDGFLGIDYSKFVPMLIKEVQDLREEIDNLKLKRGVAVE